MITVSLLDPQGVEVETVSGEVPEVSNRVVEFARNMIMDGLAFSVEVTSVDMQDCTDCGSTPVVKTADGDTVCGSCWMPYQ